MRRARRAPVPALSAPRIPTPWRTPGPRPTRGESYRSPIPSPTPTPSSSRSRAPGTNGPPFHDYYDIPRARTRDHHALICGAGWGSDGCSGAQMFNPLTRLVIILPPESAPCRRRDVPIALPPTAPSPRPIAAGATASRGSASSPRADTPSGGPTSSTARRWSIASRQPSTGPRRPSRRSRSKRGTWPMPSGGSSPVGSSGPPRGEGPAAGDLPGMRAILGRSVPSLRVPAGAQGRAWPPSIVRSTSGDTPAYRSDPIEHATDPDPTAGYLGRGTRSHGPRDVSPLPAR